MTVIYDWIKNIVYLYIFITAILHLLPKKEYRKYVRFFSGLLLVVLLMTPVLNIIYHKDYLMEKISFESFWQQMDNMQLDIEKMESIQQDSFIQEYEIAIGEDIKLIAEENEVYVNDIYVTLSKEYTVEYVEMNVSLKQEGGVFVEQVLLSDNSFEYPAVQSLKEKLTAFYKISDSQIQIAVQEG